MSHLTKAGLALLVFLVFAVAGPAVKADPVTLITETNGFQRSNLGNNGVPNGLDSLLGTAVTNTQIVAGSGGSFVATLNNLTFTEGFTGFGSEGNYVFSLSQLLTINGQTQVLNLAGLINIGTEQDAVHILSGDILTFDFDTFSVVATVLPSDVFATANGDFFGALSAQFVVTPKDTNAVPEPTTILLLGSGLAGFAARIRKRRRNASG
ncbi:MAG: PEP-CTERM sorting domain-containing protein [Pyrinomonadaceae bacterium]